MLNVTQRQLTHVDEAGAARMVDVSSKHVSVRQATAAGEVRTTAAVIDLLRRDALPKGDALAVARVAAIMELGCAVDEPVVVPDGDPIGAAIRAAVGDGVDLVLIIVFNDTTTTD